MQPIVHYKEGTLASVGNSQAILLSGCDSNEVNGFNENFYLNNS